MRSSKKGATVFSGMARLGRVSTWYWAEPRFRPMTAKFLLVKCSRFRGVSQFLTTVGSREDEAGGGAVEGHGEGEGEFAVGVVFVCVGDAAERDGGWGGED